MYLKTPNAPGQRDFEQCAVAPVYFAPGNHELSYMERDGTLLQQIAQASAVVMNDSFVDVTAAGQPLRIAGS